MYIFVCYDNMILIYYICGYMFIYTKLNNPFVAHNWILFYLINAFMKYSNDNIIMSFVKFFFSFDL